MSGEPYLQVHLPPPTVRELWACDMAPEKVQKRGRIMEYRFTADNFDKEVLEASEPVLVDFYADWCNPCRMMGPVVARMAEAFEGRLKVGKCNIDENMQLAQTYRISSIPAFVVFKGGKPVANYVGAMSAADFQAKIEQVLA